MGEPKEPKPLFDDREQAHSNEEAHLYGLIDGIKVYKCFNNNTRGIPGSHLDHPSDDDLKQAISESKENGSSVFIYGHEPPMLRPKIKQGDISLKKSFLHGDGTTSTNETSHNSAIHAVHPQLMAWGIKHLAPLDKDAVFDFPFKDAQGKIVTLKVRKVDTDLYNGWLEKEGATDHKFYRLTMPELLTQLQSKIEAYQQPEEKKEEPALDLKSKLQELKDKISAYKETIGGDELSDALEYDQEDFCPACEQEKCICYEHLSRPRVEFDGKKLTILFKNDWDSEDRDNFRDDLKRKARKIIHKNRK